MITKPAHTAKNNLGLGSGDDSAFRQARGRCQAVFALTRAASLIVLFWVGSITVLGVDSSGTSSAKADDWHALWSPEDFGDWQVSNYGGDGEVDFDAGTLTIGMGAALSGVTFTGDLPFPTSGYELQLTARRVEGNDFFCGLTFPYRATHATLVLGGWGGALVGVSCLDGRDASDNETASFYKFERSQWYRVRVRVRDGFIDAWIDKQRVVSARIRGRKVSVRSDVDESRPLGLTTFQTTGQIKDLQYRLLESN